MLNRIIGILIGLSLTGCVTVDTFRKMNPHERAVMVCQSQNEYKYLSQRKDTLDEMISDSEISLARGYRVHVNCYDVEVPGKTTTTCVKNYWGAVVCQENTEKEVKKQCTETPVSINPDLERDNISSWARSRDEIAINLQRIYSKCYTEIKDLSAEEAFNYYQK